MERIEITDGSDDTNGSKGPGSMCKVELECLVIEEIRKHRCMLESDQLVYDDWERAKLDPRVPLETVERLAAECLSRQKKTAAQQDALSELLDQLGYVPKVPEQTR
jgi:hypothetical protein